MKRLACVLALALASCTKDAPKPGTTHVCVCTYLTDFDDNARVEVEVCVPEGRSVDDEARRCAMESAHNHIERCACKPPGGACTAGTRAACKNR